MNFFNETGHMAIGSRLRMLADLITDDAVKIYELYDVDLKVKWFPIFFVLSSGEPNTITSIAKTIGHSHPSVSHLIKEMAEKGFVKQGKDRVDGRRNVVTLSSKGKRIAEKLVDQYADVTAAIDELTKQTTHDLWRALAEWEYLLSKKSLFERVKEEKKVRESQYIKIVPYTPEYQTVFKQLNEEWIKQHFAMEEADYKALDNPQEYIIDQGGHIFVALYKGEPVGVCGLLKMTDGYYDYELVKMAVSPKVQGKNIGFLLGQTALKKATEQGASKIYLESNTFLKPAINLYQKLGFKKIAGHSTPYKRCDIQMELSLNNTIDLL